jgi:hypothetical protein
MPCLFHVADLKFHETIRHKNLDLKDMSRFSVHVLFASLYVQKNNVQIDVKIHKSYRATFKAL